MTAEHSAAELFGDPEDTPTPAGADLVVPHPATAYFSQKFRELAANKVVRDDGGRLHRLNPHAVYEILIEQSPELPVSQSQIYRYYNGAATPRIDVVFELARLFDVSPSEFLPELDPEAADDDTVE